MDSYYQWAKKNRDGQLNDKEFFDWLSENNKITTYENHTSIEQVVKNIVQNCLDTIEPEHGVFFDFSMYDDVRLRTLVVDALILEHGWRIERYDFLRRPKE